MKKRAHPIAALATACTIQFAYAGDFDGAYIGMQAGDNVSKTTGAYSTNTKNAGAVGVEMGYNWTISGIVLGASATYDYNAKKTHTLGNGGSTKYGSNVYGVDMLVGMQVNDKLLAYVKLGDAKIDGKNEMSSFSKNALHDGLGLSYAVARNWTVGAEWTDARAKQSGTRLINDNIMITTAYHFGT